MAAAPDGATPKHRRGHEYEVGYARPPAKTKYKKGVSGNPRGRPKKIVDPYDRLFEILNEEVTVTIGGETKRITRNEARLRALLLRALQGDISAFKEFERQRRLFPSLVAEAPRAVYSLDRMRKLVPQLFKTDDAPND